MEGLVTLSKHRMYIGILVSVLIVSSANAQRVYSNEALERDSVYHSYGSAVFARGGYVFDGTEGDLDDLVLPDEFDELTDTSAIYGSAGVRSSFHRAGDSTFSVEGEVVVARDSIDLTEALGETFDASIWVVAPQLNARWQYNADGVVAPYASVGVGPAVQLLSVDTSFGEFEDTDVSFSYNGRAGLEFNVARAFGVEAGYRYLGITDGLTTGYHAGEIGLNFKF